MEYFEVSCDNCGLVSKYNLQNIDYEIIKEDKEYFEDISSLPEKIRNSYRDELKDKEIRYYTVSFCREITVKCPDCGNIYKQNSPHSKIVFAEVVNTNTNYLLGWLVYGKDY